MVAIIYGYYVKNGGISRFISETLKRVKNKQEYEIFTIKCDIDPIEGTRVSLVECERDQRFISSSENLSFSSEVENILRDRKFNLVHSHGVYKLKPSIYTAHICLASYFEKLSEMFGNRIRDFDKAIDLEKSMLENLTENHIFPVSKKVAFDMSKKYGFDEAKFRVIHGASRFEPRYQQGLLSGKKKVGVIGNNFCAKGMNFFCDTVNELGRRGLDATGVAAGCDNETKVALKSRLNNRVEVHGKISLDEDFFTGLDCYLMLSVYEGFSLSTLEAMSLGIPVVSSELNGVFYDSKLENPCVTLAEVEDPANINEVTNVVERILTDGKFRTKIIESGLDIVKKLSWQSVAESYEEIYSSVKSS